MKAFWLALWVGFKAFWSGLFSQQVESELYRAIFIADDDDIPKIIPDKKVYIVGVPGNEWLAVLKCPCGCGAKLPLNLLEDDDPCWGWHVDKEAVVTLTPSVWRKVGCKSHFFLREGLIKWC